MKESKYLKDNIENIERLLSIPVLKQFSTQVLGSLLNLSKIRQYEDEEVILEEGNKDPWIYFIISGKVKIVKNNEVLTLLERRGDIFGEMGLLGHTEKTASAYSVGHTVCLTTDSSHIEQLSKDDKLAFLYILYRVLAEVVTDRLKKTSDELIAAKKEIAQLKNKK